VNAEDTAWLQSSTIQVIKPIRPRKLAKVPFVELADGRLQGVVSSGSDISRVYVSSITAGDHTYSCSTNNNRPCGALSWGLCKHIQALMSEAVVQYGTERVARYLRIEGDVEGLSVPELIRRLNAQHQSLPSSTVFSRFLHHLSYLEVPATTTPLPEMHWFPSTLAVR